MIDLRHQLVTEGHPPMFAETEAELRPIAETRLPRPSSLLVLRTHVRTRQESWEFATVIGG